jgi:hypothetical protein
MTRLQVAACVTGARAPGRRIRKRTAAVIALAVFTVCSAWNALQMYTESRPTLGITFVSPSEDAPPSNLVPQEPGSWI